MATLVLTAVGTALGGPLGGALGALLGQSADAVLFAPKARQGARLSDLKVQTSSYGDRIPQIFGRMRVAGSVIWSTDLIEHRNKKSNGKGRPKTVEYSYSASFAVALSCRAVRSIGRVWADGNLLRDSDGRWAEAATMRLYDGSADQAVDPLIASVVGPDRCSAFRGIAYAMFEDLDLGPFGNRIPQLSFEIVADEGGVASSALAAALVGLEPNEAGPLIDGFAASGERITDVVSPLVGWNLLSVRGSGAELRLGHADGRDAVDADSTLLFGATGVPLDPVEEQRLPWARVPGQMRVRHFDPARDYQTSEQTAVVVGASGREEALELPSAMGAGAAKAQSEWLARNRGVARRSIILRCGPGALGIEPGTAVRLANSGEDEALWRLAERRIGESGVELMLAEIGGEGMHGQDIGDGGEAITAPPLPGTAATLVSLDLPGDGDRARQAPLRMIAVAGLAPGWRGADLWWVRTAGAEPEAIGRIEAALAIGQLVSPLGPMATRLLDQQGHFEVQLLHEDMALANASLGALVAGANMAAIGNEIIQFARAEPLGGGRWRVSGLLRGRGGSEVDAETHELGSQFVLIDDPALLALSDDIAWDAADGGAIEWRARGSEAIGTTIVPAGAAALRPLAPVHGHCSRLADGRLQLRWTPRSRAGARWRDGVDAPAGEAMTRFRASYRDASNQLVSLELPSNQMEILPGNSWPASIAQIEQIGDFGLSAPLFIPLP